MVGPIELDSNNDGSMFWKGHINTYKWTSCPSGCIGKVSKWLFSVVHLRLDCNSSCVYAGDVNCLTETNEKQKNYKWATRKLNGYFQFRKIENNFILISWRHCKCWRENWKSIDSVSPVCSFTIGFAYRSSIARCAGQT